MRSAGAKRSLPRRNGSCAPGRHGRSPVPFGTPPPRRHAPGAPADPNSPAHQREGSCLQASAAIAHNPRPMKKLFIKTYGCQMNVYDSARIADLLAPLGYAAAETPEAADMVVLNTCHIREKAAEKVYS